jgi:hypothetical protein
MIDHAASDADFHQEDVVEAPSKMWKYRRGVVSPWNRKGSDLK